MYTDYEGKFFVTDSASVGRITFTFIGMLRKTITLNSRDSVVVYLSEDMSLYEGDHFIKTSIDLGYYGDVYHAPIGGIASWTLQSIGDFRIELNSIVKYWKGSDYEGREFSAGIYLPGRHRWLPKYAWGSYQKLNFRDDEINRNSLRGMLTFELWHFDLFTGIGYTDEVITKNEMINKEAFTSGLIGTAAYIDPVHVGMYASLDYYPGQMMTKVGAFRTFRQLTFSAIYVQYEAMNDMIVLSIRFSLSTRYYCCASGISLQDYFNVLK